MKKIIKRRQTNIQTGEKTETTEILILQLKVKQVK